MEAIWKNGENAAKAGLMIESGGLRPERHKRARSASRPESNRRGWPLLRSEGSRRRLRNLRIQVHERSRRIRQGHGTSQKVLARLAGGDGGSADVRQRRFPCREAQQVRRMACRFRKASFGV